MAELITTLFLKSLLFKQVRVTHPDLSDPSKMRITKGYLLEVTPFGIKVKVGSTSTAGGDGKSGLVQVHFKMADIDEINEVFD